MLLTMMGVTVTLQVAFTPFSALQVIVAVPTALAVIFPEELTVTTFLLLELQVKVVMALLGVTVGLNVYVAPTFNDLVEGMDMDFTLTTVMV